MELFHSKNKIDRLTIEFNYYQFYHLPQFYGTCYIHLFMNTKKFHTPNINKQLGKVYSECI